MIIISDTSAISNLFAIGRIELLQALFQEVFIPDAVFEELQVLKDQSAFLNQTPWIKVRTPQNAAMVADLMVNLDRGEAEAIALAIELRADMLIIDEKRGREKARTFGIPVIGLLGVLLKAKVNGVLPLLKPVMEELIQKTNFFMSQELISEVMKQAGE